MYSTYVKPKGIYGGMPVSIERILSIFCFMLFLGHGIKWNGYNLTQIYGVAPSSKSEHSLCLYLPWNVFILHYLGEVWKSLYSVHF